MTTPIDSTELIMFKSLRNPRTALKGAFTVKEISMKTWKPVFALGILTLLLNLGLSTPAMAHCGMCGDKDTHAKHEKHAKDFVHKHKDKGEKVYNGDDFRKAASDYKAEAKRQLEEEGNADLAADYTRMAEIKTSAADLADEGRWDDIDWTEYQELEKKIHKKIGKK